MLGPTPEQVELKGDEYLVLERPDPSWLRTSEVEQVTRQGVGDLLPPLVIDGCRKASAEPGGLLGADPESGARQAPRGGRRPLGEAVLVTAATGATTSEMTDPV
ncbi:MAG: hypothetical protein IVW52_20405 [Acidimicrobiales bacterium]|nr:hypothetical protein [Acidimicrobiales bacterium]